VAGPLLVLLALLALIPTFLVAAGILMAITGHVFVTNAETLHEGPDLIKTKA